jgi:hypothetical protein
VIIDKPPSGMTSSVGQNVPIINTESVMSLEREAQAIETIAAGGTAAVVCIRRGDFALVISSTFPGSLFAASAVSCPFNLEDQFMHALSLFQEWKYDKV